MLLIEMAASLLSARRMFYGSCPFSSSWQDVVPHKVTRTEEVHVVEGLGTFRMRTTPR